MPIMRAELCAASQGGTTLPKQTAHPLCQAWSVHPPSDQAFSAGIHTCQGLLTHFPSFWCENRYYSKGKREKSREWGTFA